MAKLVIKSADSCTFDQVSMGEVMLRLDPGEGRIRTTRQFRAWEGGGEYNVARGLRRCFGLRTAIVTALADNEVGRLIEDLMLQGGSIFPTYVGLPTMELAARYVMALISPSADSVCGERSVAPIADRPLRRN